MRDRIDFGDNSVNLIGQAIAALVEFPAKENQLVDILAQLAHWVDFEAERAQMVERSPVAIHGRLAANEIKIRHEFELPRRRDRGVEHSQRARCGIPGVGVEWLAILFALFIQSLEGAAADDGFSARFKALAGIDFERQAADRARIFSDVFAHAAIATSDGAGHTALREVNGHGQPIQFQFGDISIRLIAKKFADTTVEFSQLRLVQSVVQAEHGSRVGQFDESFAGLAADSLRG